MRNVFIAMLALILTFMLVSGASADTNTATPSPTVEATATVEPTLPVVVVVTPTPSATELPTEAPTEAPTPTAIVPTPTAEPLAPLEDVFSCADLDSGALSEDDAVLTIQAGDPFNLDENDDGVPCNDLLSPTSTVFEVSELPDTGTGAALMQVDADAEADSELNVNLLITILVIAVLIAALVYLIQRIR